MSKSSKSGFLKLPKFRIIKFWLIQKFVLPIGWIVARLYFRSWRIDPELRRLTLEATNNKRHILIYWHTHVLMCIGMLYRIHRDMKYPVVILLSPSRDGELVEKILQSMGQRVVRGSSSKNSVRSLVLIRKEMAEGATPLFPIDGPKGPRGVPKPGPFLIAEKENIPPHVGLFHATGSWKLNSWDKQVIPFPFTKIKGSMEQMAAWDEAPDRDDFLRDIQQIYLKRSEELGQDVSDVERL